MRAKEKTSLKSFIHNENGASAVEFAIICPILIILLFGIIEFGLVYRDYLAITHAAREGARMAAVGEFSASKVQARAYPVNPTSISVSYVGAGAKHGEPVRVEVVYDRPLHIPMFSTQTVHLVGSAQMRIEY